QLEIYADDVKCTHGATVGRLDDDALHYLRSRGIPLVAARAMLIDAFLRDVTDSITHEAVRAHVAALIASAASEASEASGASGASTRATHPAGPVEHP
ncbi:MAG TPA: SufD family Fe-S cluster assembly protein, partial [Ilumatobacteraceae bacterium]|nr:SufD family Fe-S cluster assembly protein [Ilumatobacteraceae bacterium]